MTEKVIVLDKGKMYSHIHVNIFFPKMMQNGTLFLLLLTVDPDKNVLIYRTGKALYNCI